MSVDENNKSITSEQGLKPMIEIFMAEEEEEEDDEADIPEESKISKTLSDKTVKTVVMLVLFLLFMLAICSSETYIDSDNLHTQGLMNLRKIYDRIDKKKPDNLEYQTAYNHYLNKTTSNSVSYKLVFLRVPDPKYVYDPSPKIRFKEFESEIKLKDLRKDEY